MGLIGVYVNSTDLWDWTPYETLELCNSTKPGKDQGNWNAMLYPLLNTTAKGGIFYEGQVDVEEGSSLETQACMLNGTLSTWMAAQVLLLGLASLQFCLRT